MGEGGRRRWFPSAHGLWGRSVPPPCTKAKPTRPDAAILEVAWPGPWHRSRIFAQEGGRFLLHHVGVKICNQIGVLRAAGGHWQATWGSRRNRSSTFATSVDCLRFIF